MSISYMTSVACTMVQSFEVLHKAAAATALASITVDGFSTYNVSYYHPNLCPVDRDLLMYCCHGQKIQSTEILIPSGQLTSH